MTQEVECPELAFFPDCCRNHRIGQHNGFKQERKAIGRHDLEVQHAGCLSPSLIRSASKQVPDAGGVVFTSPVHRIVYLAHEDTSGDSTGRCSVSRRCRPQGARVSGSTPLCSLRRVRLAAPTTR